MKLSTPEEMESVDEPPEGDNPATGERIVELNGEEMPVSDAVEYLGGWATSINSDQSNFHERLGQLEERVAELERENQELENAVSSLGKTVTVLAESARGVDGDELNKYLHRQPGWDSGGGRR